MGDLTAMDVLVLFLVGGGALRGFMNGLVQELLSLVAWVMALAAVWALHAPVTGWANAQIGGGGALLAFILLFGGVFGVGRFASRRIGQRSRRSMVGGLDRGLGAGFGAVKGLLLAAIGFMLVTMFYDLATPGARPGWMLASRSYPAMSASAAAISKVVAERKAAGEANGR